MDRVFGFSGVSLTGIVGGRKESPAVWQRGKYETKRMLVSEV